MEDVYIVKVRTKPDTRNVFPSERRYSASTVSGLAWVHIALAATAFLLLCLALVNSKPDAQLKRLQVNNTEHRIENEETSLYNMSMDSQEAVLEDNGTDNKLVLNSFDENNCIMIIAPSFLAVFGLAAGIAAIVASVKWYVDRNITWLFIMSILSTLFSFIAFVMVLVWFVATSEGKDDVTEFFKEQESFKDYFIVKHSDVIDKNGSHLVIGHNSTRMPEDEPTKTFTKRVLCINILIAAFLEFLWSVLSVRISYKGMKSRYKDDDEERSGNCVAVVTTVKGNHRKRLSKDGKLIPQKPDLVEHYPNRTINQIFLAQGDNGFYLKNQQGNDKNGTQTTDTSSEFYKERMINFLNGCSMEDVSNSTQTPSVQSEAVHIATPETVNHDVSIQENPLPTHNTPIKGGTASGSWGDTPEHTVYNQNNINFDEIFRFSADKENKLNSETDGVTSEIVSRS